MVRGDALLLTFARPLLDCQHVHAAHARLLHGGGRTRAAGETSTRDMVTKGYWGFLVEMRLHVQALKQSYNANCSQ